MGRPRGALTAAFATLVIAAFVPYWLNRSPPTFEQRMSEARELAAYGRFSKAIGIFNQALNLRPDSAEAFRGRASAKMNIAHFEEALEDLDLALRLDPRYAQAYYDRAVTKYQLQRTRNEICADLERACGLDQHRACWQRSKAGCLEPGPPAG